MSKVPVVAGGGGQANRPVTKVETRDRYDCYVYYDVANLELGHTYVCSVSARGKGRTDEFVNCLMIQFSFAILGNGYVAYGSGSIVCGPNGTLPPVSYPGQIGTDGCTVSYIAADKKFKLTVYPNRFGDPLGEWEPFASAICAVPANHEEVR